MKVNFENVLVCDVVCNQFEGKNYYGLIVYQNGFLYRISIPNGSQNTYVKEIGNKITFNAEMKFYNGKNKFKIV